MQPENNTQNNMNASVAPTGNAMAQRTSSGEAEKTKMSKKQVIGLVVLSLIAVGGVLFGIYGMNSQNEQIAQLTVRATDAEGKVAELETDKITIAGPDGTTEITDSAAVLNFQNPVIKSNDPGLKYSLGMKSSNVPEGSSGKYIIINVDEGRNISCTKWLIGDSYEGDCAVSGLSGEVYKIVEFGEGQENSGNSIGFIMTDGTVQYFPLWEAVLNDDYSIRGTANIDGYVVDALDIAVSPTDSPVGGYGSTVFVLSDGSYVKYDKSIVD